MPYEERSNLFRYIIPTTLLLIFMFILSPEIILNNVKNIQDMLVLILAILLIGFAIDVALLPIIVKGIQIIQKKITKQAIVYDCIQIIQAVKMGEIEKIKDDKIQSFIDSRITPISIFDAYVNENENENTIGRLFFLFDMLHSMSNCTFVCVVALLLPIFLYTLYGIVFSSLLVYYLVVVTSFIVFVKIRQNYYDKANNFMYTLVVKDIEKLRKFIQKIIAGTIITYFRSGDEKYNILYSQENYKEIILSLNNGLEARG